MGRLSSILITIINTLTLLISIPILFVALFPFFHEGRFPGAAGGGDDDAAKATQCFKTIQIPFLTFALFLFIISLLGMIGSCGKVTSFLWTYLVVMFLLILGLICFTIFTFEVITTTKATGAILNENGHPFYSLKGYSPWLTKHVVDGRSWEKLKNCMVGAKVCHNTAGAYSIIDMKRALERPNPIQSGCCMPPTFCGFTYINGTIWEVTKKSKPNYPNGDCTTWNNKEDVLCYNCESCKGGILQSLTKEGKSLTKFNISILVFLIIVYIIACSTFKNNHSQQYKGYSYP
ncbi:Tetraspanin/Peripherin [Macleaya cordata]|uniref:Tetraspanin/Peripherin n=1 Tax=Macleaya cordata TaxID=56857 RepID=A0A200PTC4_MACCD|nr:Tetraspanin/Peripherin [Macleaya cordata]